MNRLELEEMASTAIREHRRLLAADQEVYDEWMRACEDPAASSSVRETLQAEYLFRQKKSEAQQQELSEIIEALGFIPVVLPDDPDLK
jgi:TraR antiactivator